MRRPEDGSRWKQSVETRYDFYELLKTASPGPEQARLPVPIALDDAVAMVHGSR